MQPGPTFAASLVAVVAIAFVLVFILRTVARYYKKVSPNTVAVVTGRRHKTAGGERGYRYIVGGGFFLIPIVEKMEEMSLNVIPVNVNVHSVPDRNGALVTVEAIANVKILSDSGSLPLAIERFLGKTEDYLNGVIQQTLEGNLRAIVCTMEVEELLRERQKFTQNVIEEAGADLAKMGLGVDVLKIQNISDARNYIESLGKKRTAEVVRDATIGEAEAKRDAAIKSAEAKQLGETATALADQNISNANRERDVIVATNEALIAARRAQVPIAAQVAQAESTKNLNIATVEAQKAQVTAQIALKEEEAKRNDAEFKATIVVKADKEREALVIHADGERQAAEKTGEASRIKMEKEGEGVRARMTAEAEGRKKAAEALQAEMEAKASGEKAALVAEADGLRAKLLAEAEGVLKKAEAYKQLDDTGRLILVLTSLPPVIEALGGAFEKVIKPTAEAIGQGLGNIDEVRIIDMGNGMGNGTNGRSLLGGFANIPVETIYEIKQKLDSLGMTPLVEAVCKHLGLDLNALGKIKASGGTGSATLSDHAADAAKTSAPPSGS